MLQFYFLSILLNLLAGLVFIYATNESEEAALSTSNLNDPFSDDDFSSSKSNSSSSDDFNPETDDIDFGFDDEASPKAKSPKKTLGLKALATPFLVDKTFQLVVGILSLLTGLMKLLSPIQYDVAVIGDLIPALAGFAAGAVLLLDWYQERSENIYTSGRKYLGIFCIIAAVLHFIFPVVLFL